MTNEQITTECAKLIELGDELLAITPTQNPIDIATQLGITIRFIKTKRETPGFVLKGDTIQSSTIYINDELDNYSKKIICAHELGHLYSDKLFDNDFSLFDESIDSESEFFANFMVYCLMRRVFVFAALDKYKTIHEFNSYVASRIHYRSNQ